MKKSDEVRRKKFRWKEIQKRSEEDNLRDVRK